MSTVVVIPFSAPPPPILVAGQTGVNLQVYANTVPPPTDPIYTNQSTSCTLFVRSPENVITQLVATPSADGSYVTRVTSSTDFPTPGNYMITLNVINGAQEFNTPEMLLQVWESLAD